MLNKSIDKLFVTIIANIIFSTNPKNPVTINHLIYFLISQKFLFAKEIKNNKIKNRVGMRHIALFTTNNKHIANTIDVFNNKFL